MQQRLLLFLVLIAAAFIFRTCRPPDPKLKNLTSPTGQISPQEIVKSPQPKRESEALKAAD